MNLAGQRVLITGGTAGVGLALAETLLAAGARVVICGRDATRLATARRRLDAAVAIAGDVADETDCRHLVGEAAARLGGLSLLVNNAGIQNSWRVADGDVAAARGEIAVNFAAPVLLTALAWSHLVAARGAVVNIGSGLGFAPKRAAPVYCATKAALAMWSRALRLQAADDGVRVVQVVLPLVDTAMTAGRGANKIDAMTAARAVARGLERDRDDIFVGKARLLPFMNRLAPGVLAHALRET